MEYKDPGRYIPIIYLLYSWGSLVGAPSRVPLAKGFRVYLRLLEGLWRGWRGLERQVLLLHFTRRNQNKVYWAAAQGLGFWV